MTQLEKVARAKFEAWWFIDAPNEIGSELDLEGELAWEAWQAALSAMDDKSECQWADDSDMGDTWESSCGITWTFPDAGPIENGMKFCPVCGKHLVVLPEPPRGES